MNERIEFIRYIAYEDKEGIRHNDIVVDYKCSADRTSFSNSESSNDVILNNYDIVLKVRNCEFTRNLEFNTRTYKVRYKNIIFNIANAFVEDRYYISIKLENKS